LREHVSEDDTVLILGAGTGFASFCYRALLVKTMIAVDLSPERLDMLNRSYNQQPGVIIEEDDPTEVSDLVDRFNPSVVLLDLRGRETSMHVALDIILNKLDSVCVLGILYAKPYTDEAMGLEEALQCWVDEEDDRWKVVTKPQSMFAVYTR